MTGEAVAELMRQLTAADAAPDGVAQLAPRSRDEWVALAWALKDACQAAWTEEPPRTQRCAQVLAQVAQQVDDGQIRAAAAWCEGMALLVTGKMEEAIERLDDAHAGLTAIGMAQRAAQSQVLKVMALAMLGRHDEALVSGQKTLQALIDAGDELGAGKVELNLGWMLMRRDRYESAMHSFKRAGVRFARAGDAKHSIMADIGVASALTWQFEFDEASCLYDRCMMRLRARGLASLESVVHTHRGRMDLHRGQLESALRSLHAALRQAEIDGRPHDLVEARRDLANAYLALNLLPEALMLYGQTVEACIELDYPVGRAWAEVQRALVLVRSGDLQAAEQALEVAHDLFKAAANEVGMALTQLRHAALLRQTGTAATAVEVADAAAAAFAAARAEGWRREAELLSAEALAALGETARARSTYEQVLEATAELASLRAPCLTGLGLLLRGQGEREIARVRFEEAVVHTETQRETLPGDEFRTAFGADKQRPYDALIEMALEDRDVGAAWRTLQAIERARAPALRSALHRRSEAGALDEAQREGLHWLHAQWQLALAQQQIERAAQLQSRARELEQEWLEHVRRRQVAEGGPPPDLTRSLQLPSDEEALRARVPADTAFVVYAIVGTRLAACVITRERIDAVTTSAESVVERIEQFRFQIDSLRFGAPTLRAHASQLSLRCRTHLQALYASVWQPVAQFVAGCERVVVVPHRELHYLPFAALHDGQNSLIERHEMALSPGLALALAGNAPAPCTLRLRRVVALGVGGHALPHVAREVHAVADAFEAREPGTARLHLDAEATHAALRASLADTDVLHLACHGQFRADSPYFSALHLADGPLTVRDAADLPLSAQLVTLSACETGMSKIAPGDEQLGLLRGFLMAGAPRVLSTYWTVDDASTATLMARFYRDLLAGARPAAALRAAQRQLALEHPHPYHWAAFALHERGH